MIGINCLRLKSLRPASLNSSLADYSGGTVGLSRCTNVILAL